jgi:hypothetical protein
MQYFLCLLIRKINCEPLDDIAILIGLGALIAAWIIPKRIMLNQAYIALTTEYRSPEMGAAVLAVFYFYTHDCKNSVSNISDAYRARYQKEMVQHQYAPAKILHFQRRLIAQFYYDMASLRYDYHFPRLSAKQLQRFFTPHETELLSLILHMAKPASEVFEKAENLSSPAVPPENGAYMNKLLYRLYEETDGSK